MPRKTNQTRRPSRTPGQSGSEPSSTPKRTVSGSSGPKRAAAPNTKKSAGRKAEAARGDAPRGVGRDAGKKATPARGKSGVSKSKEKHSGLMSGTASGARATAEARATIAEQTGVWLSSPGPGDPVIPDWPTGIDAAVMGAMTRAAAWGIRAASAAERCVRGVIEPETPAGLRSAPAAWKLSERAGWPTRPLRLGLRLSARDARLLKAAPGSAAIEFEDVGSEVSDGAQLADRALDALVAARGDGLVIIAAERVGREAAWYDWSAARPVSFASVFPTRIDCGRVTLPGVSLEREEDAALARALAEAAAVSARSEARLGADDRLLGRSATDGPQCSGSGLAGAVERVFRGVLNLGGASVSLRRAGARAGAGLASSERSGLDLTTRRVILEAAASIIGDEPGIMLALGAARLADFDDPAGFDALLRADRMLRGGEHDTGIDHAAFVQAELDQRRGDVMSLGRVAAGVVLMGAPLTVDRLLFTREDLLDAVRFAEWLVGRDPDRALLMELTAALVAQRRSERMALPMPKSVGRGKRKAA